MPYTYQAVYSLALALTLGVYASASSAQPSTLAEETDRALNGFAHGDEDRAYPKLRNLVQRPPTSPWVYIFAGAYERKHGRTEDAKNTFSLGTERFPDNAVLFTELAVTQSWLGDLQGAHKSYRRALELDPSNPNGSLELARILAWLGHHEEASTFLDSLDALTSTTNFKIRVQLIRAMIATLNLDVEAAEAIYAGIISRDPNNIEARDGLLSARATTRHDIGVEAGAIIMAGRLQSTLSAHAGYRLTATFDVKAGYLLDGLSIYRDPVPAKGTSPAFAHRIGASAVWKATPAVTTHGGYELQLRGGRATHVAELGGSVGLGRSWTVMVGSRTFFGQSAGLLVNAGLQWAHSEHAFVLLQGFHFNDMNHTGGTIGVLTVQQPVNDSWIPKASLGLGTHSDTGMQTTVSASIRFRGWAYADLELSYERFAANFKTHRIKLKFERRF